MADERNFELKIITPDRVFYEGEAVMVEFNTTEGEIGIYKHHIPMTVIIKPGILTITEENDETREAALHAGFVEILPDKVTIMVEILTALVWRLSSPPTTADTRMIYSWLAFPT